MVEINAFANDMATSLREMMADGEFEKLETGVEWETRHSPGTPVARVTGTINLNMLAHLMAAKGWAKNG